MTAFKPPEVANARTGASLPIAPYGGSLTYTASGRDGSAVATVTPSGAGEYVVRTDGDPGPTGATVALGRSLAGPLLRWVLGTFAIGGLVAGSGVILLVVTAIRRSRARRTPAELEPG